MLELDFWKTHLEPAVDPDLLSLSPTGRAVPNAREPDAATDLGGETSRGRTTDTAIMLATT